MKTTPLQELTRLLEREEDSQVWYEIEQLGFGPLRRAVADAQAMADIRTLYEWAERQSNPSLLLDTYWCNEKGRVWRFGLFDGPTPEAACRAAVAWVRKEQGK